MSQLYKSFTTKLPGIDLTLPASATLFKQALTTVEFISQQSNQPFAIVSLKPGRLLYTCPTYSQMCNIEANLEKNHALHDWLHCLTTCSGMPIGNHISPFLQELSSIPHQQGEEIPLVVFDFCIAKKGKDAQRIQHQIRQIHLEQKTPEVLFFCEVQILEHLPPTFSHFVRLKQGSNLLKQEVVSPPITDHPILKDFSATERKLFQQIYLQGGPKDVHIALNMAPDTVKTHKKHILQKTGLPNIGALLTFINSEIGK